MNESKMFTAVVGGVAVVFMVSIAVGSVDGHEPVPHIDNHITQPMPGVFGTAQLTSSGALFG